MWLKREDIVTFNSSEFLYRSAHGAFIGRVFNKKRFGSFRILPEEAVFV